MPERVGAHGHWIGILAKNKHYYVADSLNQEDPFCVNQLREILTSKQVWVDLQYSGEFENLLDSIINRLSNSEFRGTEKERVTGALESLQKIDNLVSANDLLDNDGWKMAYHERVSKLVTATIKRENGLSDLDHETRLKTLDELQQKLCE